MFPEIDPDPDRIQLNGWIDRYLLAIDSLDLGDDVPDPLDAGGARLHLREGVVVGGHVGDHRLLV